MEGVDLHNTPYLHPNLNKTDDILSKELGYGFILGSLGGFAYHALPNPPPPSSALSPLLSRLHQTPLANYAAELLKSPLFAKLNESPQMAQLHAFLAKSAPATASEAPFMARIKALWSGQPRMGPPLKARLSTAVSSAPMVGMHFGLWVALRAYLEYKLAGFRDKADSVNSFVSSAVVGGLASAYYRGPFVAPVIASGVLLGTGVAMFDSACNRWYFKNYERKGLNPPK